ARLLLRQFAQALMALTLQATDTSPGDNQCLSGVGADSSKVDFSQIDRRLLLARSLLSLWDFYAYMQLKAMVPDQRTRPALLRQSKRQDDGFAPFAHRQDHPTLFLADSLSRPLDRVEPLRPPRILHLHVRLGLPKLPRGFDVGKKCSRDLLYRLT